MKGAQGKKEVAVSSKKIKLETGKAINASEAISLEHTSVPNDRTVPTIKRNEQILGSECKMSGPSCCLLIDNCYKPSLFIREITSTFFDSKATAKVHNRRAHRLTRRVSFSPESCVQSFNDYH